MSDERRDCECGNYIVTNDEYMIDAWNEWHERGSFLAGKYHGPAEPPDLNFSQPFPVDGVPKCVRQLVGPSGYIEAYCMLPNGHAGKHSPKPTDARSEKPE